MSYYKLLGLEREPFSTSPDPHFFFLSQAHRAALYRLRIAVKLQRGLCLVLGALVLARLPSRPSAEAVAPPPATPGTSRQHA